MRQGVLVIPGAQFMKGPSRKLGFSMVKTNLDLQQTMPRDCEVQSHTREENHCKGHG